MPTARAPLSPAWPRGSGQYSCSEPNWGQIPPQQHESWFTPGRSEAGTSPVPVELLADLSNLHAAVQRLASGRCVRGKRVLRTVARHGLEAGLRKAERSRLLEVTFHGQRTFF